MQESRTISVADAPRFLPKYRAVFVVTAQLLVFKIRMVSTCLNVCANQIRNVSVYDNMTSNNPENVVSNSIGLTRRT